MSIDLNNFPTSEIAKRMLTYVTKGWYDNSYVGKWVFQAMGLEMDDWDAYFKDFPNQLFVDTATWALRYHEIKYGLTVREDLSYAERRRRINEVKYSKAPLSPWRMEKILSGATDYTVNVYDINDPGPYTFAHPNTFWVQFIGDEEIDMLTVIKKIRKLKQSHTTFGISFLDMIILIEEYFVPRVTYRSPFIWWDQFLDGAYRLDGTIDLDAGYPTKFTPHFIIPAQFVNTWTELIRHRMFNDMEEEIDLTPIIRFAANWWEGVLDGEYKLDGDINLDQVHGPYWRDLQRLFCVLPEETDFDRTLFLFSAPYSPVMETVNVQRVLMNWWEGERVLDGEYLLDGTIDLDQERPPIFTGIQHRLSVVEESDPVFTWYVPADAVTLNGVKLLDGSINLNSGREVL